MHISLKSLAHFSCSQDFFLYLPFAKVPFQTRGLTYESFERQLYFGDGDCGPASHCLGGHTCYTLLVHKGYTCADLKDLGCPCYHCYCSPPQGAPPIYAATPGTPATFCDLVRVG